jgi:hypothetical protein
MPVNIGRRELTATLGSVVVRPLAAQRMPVVGFLGPGSAQSDNYRVKAFQWD